MKSGREGVISVVRRGFTLVELLLVLVIMGIATGLAIPSFVRSYQSAKLRTSARTVVMASRYARSVAVLQQLQAALLYDMEKHTIEVVVINMEASAEDRSGFLDARKEPKDARVTDDQAEETGPSASVASRLRKAMAEDVRIISVEREEEGREMDNIFWVNYYPNGMCDQHTVRLRDKHNKTVRIEVDPMSAKAAVEYE